MNPSSWSTLSQSLTWVVFYYARRGIIYKKKNRRREHTSVGDPDPHVFGILDPDPLVRGTDPDPYPAPDPSLFS